MCEPSNSSSLSNLVNNALPEVLDTRMPFRHLRETLDNPFAWIPIYTESAKELLAYLESPIFWVFR
jgi:hypothetical protein